MSKGYHLHERLINSIEYGAPQDRDRIILIGFKNDSLNQYFDWGIKPFEGRSAFDFPWPQAEDFLVDAHKECPKNIPVELTVKYWFDKNEVEKHPNAKHVFTARAGLARFMTVQEGDDSRKSYKRLHRWRYSPTAAYGNNEVHLHPFKPRRITVAEALAIQSLPVEFELPQNMTLSNMFKTVGNGVPYLAALGIAKTILSHLDESNEANSCKSGKRNILLTQEHFI
jgi:DNA (cytosine-5)-methyltransferase 1